MKPAPARDLTPEALTLFVLQAVIWGALALKALQAGDMGALLGFALLAAANAALAITRKVHSQ